ncbi:thiamine transporter 1-like [Macrosteles quadrilineatus]|uniref:thiamine transporter 1-like n=1 Tax=Macrosteles quadrilineatus TaxID=74068 RepID=UPI0023E27E73|nr:thiamine transporter 1-like [Macrosteles quadrilineatus]
MYSVIVLDEDKDDSVHTKTATTSQIDVPSSDSETQDTRRESNCHQVASLLWKDLKDAYTNLYVLKFCIWVALATCGYNQMMTYVQILWVKIGGKQQVAYNGAVEAVYTIISAVSTLAFGQLNANWSKYGEAFLGLLTILQGVVLAISANTDSMFVAYTAYIIFGMLYNIMLVMTNSEVARYINEDSYALIFGVNTFVGLILQTVLTLTVAGEGGFEIPIRSQFVVYGAYFIVLGVVYAVKSVFNMCSR